MTGEPPEEMREALGNFGAKQPITRPPMTTPELKLHFQDKPDMLLRDTEASGLLGIGRSTFHRWVAAGDLPKPVKLGGCTRWWKSEIEAHLTALSDARETACG